MSNNNVEIDHRYKIKLGDIPKNKIRVLRFFWLNKGAPGSQLSRHKVVVRGVLNSMKMGDVVRHELAGGRIVFVRETWDYAEADWEEPTKTENEKHTCCGNC